MAKDLTGEALARVGSNGWHWLRFTAPGIDSYGHTMEDGTYYPPTMKMGFKLLALRTDGEYFEINVTFEHSEIDFRELMKLTAKMENAALTLDTFRTCACTAEVRCEKHL